MINPIKWGILAAGGIANAFAEALKGAEGNELYAVSSRDVTRAEEFAANHGGGKAYGSYDAMLADPDVEAVYIATLHPFHLEWIGKCVHAGKHVLCEKPLAMNLREATQAKAMADRNRCLLREAFMYRHHPQTQKVVDLIEAGAIGKVRMVDTSFCFNQGEMPDSRWQAKNLGGGAILDVGCYALSMARLYAGRSIGKLFAEPIELKAVGHLDAETKTDMWTTASLRFEQDILATCTVAMRMGKDSATHVLGENGRIRIANPIFCEGKVELLNDDGSLREDWEFGHDKHLYAHEIESFAREMRGQPVSAREVAMRFDDTLGNMKALDRWRAEIGLRYEADLTK